MSRKASEEVIDADAPTKKARKEPKSLGLWRNKIFYCVAITGEVSAGHLNEETALNFERAEANGTLGTIKARGFGICRDELQGLVSVFTPKPRWGSEDWVEKRDGWRYMEKTCGLVTPGLEDRFRQRIAKCYGGKDRIGSALLEALDRTVKVREKDNLYHIYALFMHFTRVKYEMERLFLWIVTGSGVKNKHGVLVTEEQVQILYGLLEAESNFGVPVLDGDVGKFERYERLDLTNIIADLIQALARQHFSCGATFVRPLAPSLYFQDGYQNVVKLELAKHYGIDLNHPGYISRHSF